MLKRLSLEKKEQPRLWAIDFVLVFWFLSCEWDIYFAYLLFGFQGKIGGVGLGSWDERIFFPFWDNIVSFYIGSDSHLV